MATNLGLDLRETDNSKSSSAATIGDNSYFVDNGINLDLSGAVVDTSTKLGLMGEDLHAIGNIISGITNNAFSAILGITAQNKEAVIEATKGNGSLGIQTSNMFKTPYMWWVLLGVLLIVFKIKGRK
ncbi:hypothetical protein [uncultured Helicobacter sp.]|uniref:hypothetical protein n=1 Tax=uncultured Helicobacter sp. TaxID=175537 RepID=UPI002633F140|nr:hypothetical protein [uncultured Helicobacter sp.]